jgi:hypothetical protein
MWLQLREQIHSDLAHSYGKSGDLCGQFLDANWLRDGTRHLVIELLDNLPSFMQELGTPISSCIVSTMVASMSQTYMDVSKSSIGPPPPR